MKKLIYIATLLLYATSCTEERDIVKTTKNVHIEAINSLSDLTQEEFDQTLNDEEIFNLIISPRNESKQNNRLKLSLANGKSLVFVNNDGQPYDEDIASYVLLGEYAKINRFLVKAELYENDLYLLVDKKTGRIDSLNGFPHISKNAKFLFTYEYNPYETYVNIVPPTYDFTVYCLNKDNSYDSCYIKPFSLEIDTVIWKSNYEILFRIKDKNRKKKYEFKKLIIDN